MNDQTAPSSPGLKIRLLSVAVLALLLAALLPGAIAQAKAGNSCDNRTNNTYRKLLDCLTAEGALDHLEAFQDIADANQDEHYPGTRAAGTEGYQASVEYVAGLLEDAGWKVVLDPVDITFTFPVILRQLTPIDADYESGVFTGAGSGNVTGPVTAVDLNLSGDRANDSGCQASDFAGVDLSGPNDVVLVQRGTCNFSDKAINAEAAGAEALIIFNQGSDPTRQGLIVGTLGGANVVDIPVVGASFADGVALSQDGSTAQVTVRENETRTDYNVIAELSGENDDNVVMAGAHLDSVIRGPGINDNGSGSTALLELALLLSKSEPVNTLRFAWWAAEEQGLIGSTAYVNELSQEELDRIAAYLNFDMVASPNFIYGVYDADESSFAAPVPVPQGSEALEDLFEVYFTWQGIPYEDSEFSGRSDYQAFINNGIPASGLFTGAEVPKTAEQEAIWGGVAGAQYDPCYHLACDSLEGDAQAGRDALIYGELNLDYDMEGNVNLDALGTNLDAIGFAVLSLAYSTEAVNGVPGKDVPGSASLRLPAPGGPEGTVGSGGGSHSYDES